MFWMKAEGNVNVKNLDFKGNEEPLEAFEQWLDLSTENRLDQGIDALKLNRKELNSTCTWALGSVTLEHGRLDSRGWKEVSCSATLNACAHRCCAIHMPMALGPVGATFSHPAAPCLWGSFQIFFSPPGKTTSLRRHRKYSANTYKLQILPILVLILTSHTLLHWLDLRSENDWEDLIILCIISLGRSSEVICPPLGTLWFPGS